MGGPGRAQDLNYLNYLIPGPELNNLNNLNIGGGGVRGGPGWGVREGPRPGWGVREGPRI